MKKKFWLLFIIFFFIIPISNIIVFIVNNNIGQNSISEILYPNRGWPKKSKNQLNIWNFLYTDSINEVLKINNKIINGFNSFYLDEFNKYRATESQNAGKPNYDEIGIPNSDIDNYVTNKIILSKNMQIYTAFLLRTFFLELTINQINNPSSNYINSNEYLSLWVMKYFQAGIFFQWVKIWIQDLGRTIEKSINIDFYTFSSLVQTDAQGNQIWGKGPKDNKVKPLLSLDPIMNKMINDLYASILANK